MSSCPVGTINNWLPDKSFPENEEHVVPDGRLLDRNNYSELYQIIRCDYGHTDATNFRIPDISAKIKEKQLMVKPPGSKTFKPALKMLMRIK